MCTFVLLFLGQVYHICDYVAELQRQLIYVVLHFLSQCKSDLKSDEEIFAEKSRQQTDMQETIDRLEREHTELTQQLEEAQEKIRQLNEQVLAKQLEIDASKAHIQVVTNWLLSDVWQLIEALMKYLGVVSKQDSYSQR